MLTHLATTAFVILAASACASADDKPTTTTKPGEVKTASGLIYQDLKVGEGPAAKNGDTVYVHYTGWLTNGKKFDSSHDRGEPLPFKIGAGRVIKGWEEGITGMKVGGKRKLTIPANLAYGDRDVGDGLIPAGSTLVFECELMKIGE